MERHVLLKLRIANKDDFADQFGAKRIGVLYFLQNTLGFIDRLPKYFTEETDMKNFKQLYAAKQVYVPVDKNAEVAVLEEEWEEDQDMKSA